MSDKDPLSPPSTTNYYKEGAPQYQSAGPAPHSTTVIVTQQPSYVVYERRYGTGDHHLLLSVLISIICFIACGWPTLLCTIPAIFFAINAQEAEARGDRVTMEKNARIALILDLCGVVTGATCFCLVIIAIAVGNAN